jgi:hypothetical protein
MATLLRWFLVAYSLQLAIGVATLWVVLRLLAPRSAAIGLHALRSSLP